MAENGPADDFVFAGAIWFIAPKPPYSGPDEFCAVVLKGGFDDTATGKMLSVVYVFSDNDLARQFLKASGAPPHYQPYAPENNAAAVAVLERLRDHGHEFLCVDAEREHSVILPVSRAIDQLSR